MVVKKQQLLLKSVRELSEQMGQSEPTCATLQVLLSLAIRQELTRPTAATPHVSSPQAPKPTYVCKQPTGAQALPGRTKDFPGVGLPPSLMPHHARMKQPYASQTWIWSVHLSAHHWVPIQNFTSRLDAIVF